MLARRSRRTAGALAAASLLAALTLASAEALAAPAHGIAMHGAPKYGPDFAHLDYVNPDAPKGGELRRAATGTFELRIEEWLRVGASAGGRVKGEKR